MTTTTNTKTLTTTSTVDSLIGSYRAHVLGRCLPTPTSVSFHASDKTVWVQPGGGLDTVVHLADLLVWAHSLANVTAQWRRTPDDRLHVSVHGRTHGGLRVKVYGGCDFNDCLGLVALELNQSEDVTLDELYTLVGLLREAQDRKEES